MILINTLGEAIAFAANAHKDQTNWQGEPYILHPIRVMNSLTKGDERTWYCNGKLCKGHTFNVACCDIDD